MVPWSMVQYKVPPTYSNGLAQCNGARDIALVPTTLPTFAPTMKHQLLKDEHTDVADEDAPAAQVCGIVFPGDDFKVKWDFLIMFLILYSAISVPYRLAFLADAEGLVWVGEVGVSLAFIADIIVSFNTAFQRLGSDEWVTSRREIAREYVVKGSFVIDAPSSLPVELVEYLLRDSTNTESLRLLRVLRLFRLFRLLRLLKLSDYINSIEEEYDVNMRPFRVVILVLKLVFMSHLFGCGWMAVATFADPEQPTWVTEYPEPPRTRAVDGSKGYQYMLAFSWALGTLTGGGEGWAVSDAEVIYTTLGSLLGALTFGYILGEIGSLIAALDKQAAMVEEKIDAIKEYLRWRGVPRRLSLSVQRYYHHYYQSRSVFDEKEILGSLSPELHLQVVNFILDGSIGRLPLFESLTSAFQTAIFPFLKPMSFNVGDVIFERGTESSSVLFLLAGQVTVSRPSAPFLPFLPLLPFLTPAPLLAAQVRVLNPFDPSHVTHILRPGERAYLDPDGREFATKSWAGCFGQSALTGARRPATHVAHLAPCEVLIIEKSDLLGIFSADAKSTARVCKAVLADDLSEARLRNLMKRLWVNSLPRGSDERAAFKLSLAWRRRFESTAADHDEIHKLIIQHSTKPKRRKVRISADKPLRARSRAMSRATSRAPSRAPSLTNSEPTTPTHPPTTPNSAQPVATALPPAMSMLGSATSALSLQSSMMAPVAAAPTAADETPGAVPHPPAISTAAEPDVASLSSIPLPLMAGSMGEQIENLAAEVENLGNVVELLGERMAEHEETITAKLDQLLKMHLDDKINNKWGTQN